MTCSIVSIDPGKAGGLAFASTEGIRAVAMPASDDDLCRLLDNYNPGIDREVVIEEVSGFIGQAHPASRMFKFGYGAGFIYGLCKALEYRVSFVRPAKWQKFFGIGKRSDCATPREWKTRLKDCAARRFPKLNVTYATADCLLMLEWFLHSTERGHLLSGGVASEEVSERAALVSLPTSSRRTNPNQNEQGQTPGLPGLGHFMGKSDASHQDARGMRGIPGLD